MDIILVNFFKLWTYLIISRWFLDEGNSETEQSMDFEFRHLDWNQSSAAACVNVGTNFQGAWKFGFLTCIF